jgi:hypothetical protein
VDIYFKPSSDDKKMAVVIVIDLSSDDCVQSLRQWIHAISRDISSRLQPKISSDMLPSFNTPLVVVGTKSDQIRVDNIDSLKRAKSIQGQLRSVCLQNNACLVYTASPCDGDVINAAAVKEHLARQLSFDSSVIDNNRDFQIKEGTNDASIPVGCDSFDLIRASTDVDGQDFLKSLESTQFDVSSSAEAGSDGVVVGAPQAAEKILEAAVVLETEEREWFKQLKKSTTQSKSALGESELSVDATVGSAGTGHDMGGDLTSNSTQQRRASVTGGLPSVGRKTGGEEKSGSNEAVRGFFENLLTSNAPKKG